MSGIRLFILSTLAERGQMHGHQLRLQAAEDRTEQWTDIRPGALYGALARLAREGLIEPVRTERAGNYPERVIYSITPDGWRALTTVQDQMLRTVVVPSDPFDLALAHAANVAEETLHDIVMTRLLDYQTRLAAARSQLTSAGAWLSPAEQAVSEHLVARLETEVRWHEELAHRVAKIAADSTEREDRT